MKNREKCILPSLTYVRRVEIESSLGRYVPWALISWKYVLHPLVGIREAWSVGGAKGGGVQGDFLRWHVGGLTYGRVEILKELFPTLVPSFSLLQVPVERFLSSFETYDQETRRAFIISPLIYFMGKLIKNQLPRYIQPHRLSARSCSKVDYRSWEGPSLSLSLYAVSTGWKSNPQASYKVNTCFNNQSADTGGRN